MRSPRGPARVARAALRWAVLSGAAAALALGCAAESSRPGKPATSAKKPARTKLPKAEGNCINPRSITDFKVLDRSRVLVNTYPQRVIEVYDGCEGLRFADELKFAGSGGGIICDYRSDALIVDGNRCAIAAIRDYEADSDAALRKEIDGAEKEGEGKKGKASDGKSPPP